MKHAIRQFIKVISILDCALLTDRIWVDHQAQPLVLCHNYPMKYFVKPVKYY